jgi:predicted O-methyltransferase YrrM
MAPANQAWIEADRYVEQLCVGDDPQLAATLAETAKAGLPAINVSANEGKLIYLIAKLCGARRMLEIGLLGGFSATWLARALPAGGKLVSLEIDEKAVRTARANLARAGLGEKVEVRHGPALASLDAMIAAKEPPFDLVFIDADKTSYPDYLERTMKLVRPGSVILADNVLRKELAGGGDGSAYAKAVLEFNRRLAGDPRLEAIILPILRDEMDGIGIARVKG